MKKLFFLSAMIGLMAGTAAAIEIYSCNTVGVQRVTGTLSEVSAPVPFVGIGGQDATLQSLLYIENLTTGDGVEICQSNMYGYYNVWTAVNLPLAGVVGYYGSSRIFDVKGVPYTVETPEASQIIVHPGTGIKVTRSSSSGDVYVMGEYTDKAFSTTVKGNAHHYLVNPLSEAFDLDTKLTTGVNALFDRVYIGSDTTSKTYYYSASGSNGKHWYYKQNVTSNGKTTSVNQYDSPSIPSGSSFLYVRGVATDLTINW